LPNYEYSCGVCGVSRNIFRGIADPEQSYECDACNLPLKRVYSNIGVTFNGEGFYRTDNRRTTSEN
jgi:putative FmdB family regulatory protein